MSHAIENAPDFIKFHCNPENDGTLEFELITNTNTIIQKENSHESRIDRVAKAVILIMGVILGTLLGVGVATTLTGGIPGIIVGATIGASIGVIASLYATHIIDRKEAKDIVKRNPRHALELSDRVLRSKSHFDIVNLEIDQIFNALLQEENLELITCPISHQTMVFPAKVDCGSEIPHIFEYKNIIDSLKIRPECPTCRKPITSKNIIIDLENGKKIAEVIQKIVKKMEWILENSLSNPVSNLSNEENKGSGLIEKALKNISNQNSVFYDRNALLDKIRNPDTLNAEEAYTLGYYIINQFSNHIQTISTLEKRVVDMLRSMYELRKVYEEADEEKRSKIFSERIPEKISKQVYKMKKKEVKLWAKKVIEDIYPKGCSIMKALMLNYFDALRRANEQALLNKGRL